MTEHSTNQSVSETALASDIEHYCFKSYEHHCKSKGMTDIPEKYAYLYGCSQGMIFGLLLHLKLTEEQLNEASDFVEMMVSSIDSEQ